MSVMGEVGWGVRRTKHGTDDGRRKTEFRILVKADSDGRRAPGQACEAATFGENWVHSGDLAGHVPLL